MGIVSKFLKKIAVHHKKDNKRQQDDPGTPGNLPIFKKVHDNLARIREELGDSPDITIRQFKMNGEIEVAIVYIEGLSDGKMINDFIMESLFERSMEKGIGDPFNYLKEKVIALGSVKELSNWDLLYSGLLSGDTILFIEGYKKVLSGSTRGGEKRAIAEPSTQLSIRGAKDAFTESIQTNSALIRRRLKSPNLRFEAMKLGAVTQTDIAIVYLKGIADEKIVEEVRSRLNRIDVDSILGSGYIERLIEEQTFSPFPTVYHTERPDVIAANILEGKVGILVDGTPFVLSAPALFIEFFHAVEDYYQRFDISTAIRMLRVFAFFISLLGPSLFIAATTFHQELMPTTMALTIATQREGVPFPAFVEALIMEVTFEILREAGLRLPRSVGQAVSIVGALVIGQAAVQAGIVSPAMVIIVSITAIASFSTPTFAMAISARLVRFALMVLAASFGFYGVSLGILFMLLHLCSLRSFGVPYMAPLAPMIPSGQKDVFFRFPFWSMKSRPEVIAKDNIRRMGDNQMPSPEQQKGGQSNGKTLQNNRNKI